VSVHERGREGEGERGREGERERGREGERERGREGERERGREGERESARAVSILYTEYCASIILALALLSNTDCGHVLSIPSYPILGLYMYIAWAISAT
jgi:hypothetical protein